MPAMVLAALVFGCGKASILWLWLGFCVLQLCAAGGFLSASKIIEKNFHQDHWSRCFAILGVSSRIGSVGSKLGLGALLKLVSWQEVARLTGLLVLASWLIVMKLLPADDNIGSTMGKKSDIASGRKDQAHGDGSRPGKVHLFGTFPHLWSILCSPGMGMYCCIAAGSYCQAGAFENLSLLFLRDRTRLSGAGVAMVAAAFPAGLGTALVTAAPLYSKVSLRHQKFGLELLLQTLSFVALLVLAAVQTLGNISIVVACLFVVAFGIGLTYYVTVNVFPLTYGSNCATAAAILDSVGLLASMVFQAWAGSVLEHGGGWAHILVVLIMLSLSGIACNFALWLHPSMSPHIGCKTHASLENGSHSRAELHHIVGQDHKDGPADF